VLGLTSIGLVCILALLVGALLLGVLWNWPRMGRPGQGPLAMRVAALCALNACTLGLIFVTVNRANDFYSSWSDLLGRYRGGGTIVALKASAARPAALITVRGQRPVLAAHSDAAGGDLQSVTIRGQLSGLVQLGQVYVPPGYLRASSAQAQLRYPVLVAVTGATRGGSSAYSAPRLASAIAAEISARRLPPLIAVMLKVSPGLDRGCLNVPGGPQAALFYSQDLPAAIGSVFRVQPSDWALLGDQAGGYCALQLALTSAGQFAVAAIPPGGYAAPPAAPGPPPWGASLPLREQDDLSWLLGHQPMQPITVLFDGPAGPKRALPMMAVARAPMRASFVRLGASPSPLAPVLDRIGRLLGPGG
jgi:hypothetical protein